MKKIPLYIVFFVILAAWPVAAQQGERQYVTDQLTINVRSGPSLENRILAMVPVNQAVKVMEAQGEWVRVQMENGTEGWTQSRYLTKTKPAAVQAEQYQQNYKQAKEQLTAVTQDLASTKDKLQKTESRLTETTSRLDSTEKSYTQLQSESEDFLKLQKEHEEMKAANQKLTEETGKLQSANDKLLMSQRVKWFVAGSAVFLVGWIIGYTVRRSSRKKSFSLR